LDEARRLVAEAGFTSKRQMSDVLNRQITELMKEVEDRARRREEAIRENARVEESVRVLREEYEMEREGMMKQIGGQEQARG